MQAIIPDQALVGGGFVLQSRASGILSNIPAIVNSVITNGYYAASDGGGALFKRVAGPLNDGASFQSADGAWWQYVMVDVVNAKAFGLKGDNTDDTAAMTNLFAYINANAGIEVYFPKGTYVYTTSQSILVNRITITGESSVETRLLGKNGAQIILGFANTSNVINGVIQQAGTKIVGTTIRNIGIKPENDFTGGAPLLLMFCDYTKVYNCSIGPFGGTGATNVDGICCQWTQWTYFDKLDINVNNYCIRFMLQSTNRNNFDHFHITDSTLTIGKTLAAGSFPAGIYFERAAGYNTGLFEFSVINCHFVNSVTNNNIRGIAVNNGSASDQRTIIAGSNIGCMYEYIDYPFDTALTTTGAETSRMSYTGCSFIQNTVCFNGNAVTKTSVTVTGCTFLQGINIANNCRVFFGMNNLSTSMTDPLPNGSQYHRYIEHNLSNCALNTPPAAMRISGSIVLPANATSVVVPFGSTMAAAPTRFNLSTNVGSVWNPKISPGSVSATQMTLYVDVANTSDRTIYYDISCPYV